MKVVAFFSNKLGVGATTLVYHLAWMFQEMGVRTVALDLDPQADLTALFFSKEDIERFWATGKESPTVFPFVESLTRGAGNEENLPILEIASHLALVPGDLALGRLEGQLADAWARFADGASEFLETVSVFSRLAAYSARAGSADLVLIDLGSTLGALNRAVLHAADHLVMPLATDFYSIQALRNLGSVFPRWRLEWGYHKGSKLQDLSLPQGQMPSTSYVLLRHTAREDRWADRIPAIYHHEILGKPEGMPVPEPDSHRLGSLKHNRSLMPLARDARKPMFSLRAADGALGAQAQAVQDCYRDFEDLARRIAERAGVSIPKDALS